MQSLAKMFPITNITPGVTQIEPRNLTKTKYQYFPHLQDP